MGGANSNFEILNWAFQTVFRSWIASGGSNPACLGELGGNLLPLFPIKRQKGVVLRVPDSLGYAFQLFWVKKIVSVKKIQAEVLL